MAFVAVYEGSPLKTKVDEIVSKVDESKMGLVQAADYLEKAFKDGGLLYEMEIHCRQVWGVARGLSPDECVSFGCPPARRACGL